MHRRFSILIIAALCLLIGAPVAAQDNGPLNVMTTTSILADVARNIAGDLAVVDSLLPAGADTHAYQPTADDIARLSRADILFEIGVGYEAFLADMINAAGIRFPRQMVSGGLPILPLGAFDHDTHDHAEGEDDHAIEPLGLFGLDDLECLPHDHSAEEGEEHADEHSDEEHADEHEGEAHADEEHAEDEHGHAEGACDPHVWMNPLHVIEWTYSIASGLSSRDPANADVYAANRDAYIAQLRALDMEIDALVSTLPEERRVLITNHEFMGYFAVRYGFEIAATVLPGGSSDSERDAQALAELIALVRDENVPAIFAEVSANPQLAELVAQESGVSVVTALYSESLSTADGPAATYIDMMRYNAQTIVNALSGAN